MNSLAKATARFATVATNNAFKNVLGKRDFTRTLWHLSKNPGSASNGTGHTTVLSVQKPSQMCSCGCGLKHIHSKGERELVEFLTDEIIAERKAQKVKTVPSTFDGFEVKFDGADVELIKEGKNEKVVISFNVNHTVDTESEQGLHPESEKQEIGAMRSKPQFEVDIVKGDTTFSMTCSFLAGEASEAEYNDVFGIDEVTVFKGQWEEKVYAVAGEVLDGTFYDLLMNLLEEKGISNEFVEKLSDLATAYEHTLYINLLENVSKFTSEK